MQPYLHRRRFLATVGVSLVAAGCNRRSDDARTGARPAGPAIVKATDGRSQMKLPEGWTVVKDLNEHADLQVGDERRDVFAVVLTEPKEDFAADFTYRDFARKRLEAFHRQTLPVATFYKAKSLLREVDGIGPVDEVFERIEKSLL